MLSFGRVGNAAYRDVPGVYVRPLAAFTINMLTFKDSHRGSK
jgi:hypothetical protein